MRLIDAHALPMSWQPDCNGNKAFVTRRDIDAAPTVRCAECLYLRSKALSGPVCVLGHMDNEDPDAFGCSDFGCSPFWRKET